MKKKEWINVVFACIGVILFFIVVSKLDLQLMIKSLQHFSLPLFIAFFLIFGLIFLIQSLRWKIILRAHGHSVSIFKAMSYKLAAYPVNYIAPTHVIGEPIRMNIISKEQKIPHTKTISSVLIDKGIEIITDLSIGLVILIVLIEKYIISKRIELLIITALAFLVIAILFILYKIYKGAGVLSFFLRLKFLNRISIIKKYEKQIFETEEHMIVFFRHHRKESILAFCISYLSWPAIFLEYAVGLQLIGVYPSVITIALVIFSVYISFGIPIPAAIGALEITQHSLFSLMNIPSSPFLLTLFIRARDIIWIIIGALIFIHYKSGLKEMLLKHRWGNHNAHKK